MSDPHRHRHPPKPFLVERVGDLPPGAALEIGCGHGVDALWLASRGWTVTALDVSASAVERARTNDPEGRVTWHQADFMTWPLPGEPFDLATAHFVHVEPSARPTFFAKVARALRPGGILSFASHHPSDLETDVGRPAHAELYFTADEVKAHLPGSWEWLESGTRPRKHAHGDHDEGRSIEVVDTVLFARRLG